MCNKSIRRVHVGAIAEIHQLINKLARCGNVDRHDLPYLLEIQNLSDRTVILRAGRAVATLDPSSTEDEIMFAAMQ